LAYIYVANLQYRLLSQIFNLEISFLGNRVVKSLQR